LIEAAESGVDRTVTLASAVAAGACQISAVPACVLTRFTRVQVNPAPLTVSVCALLGGPSEAARATTSSPAAAVLNAAVVTVPFPSTDTSRSTMGVPAETTRLTAEPNATGVPAAGF